MRYCIPSFQGPLIYHFFLENCMRCAFIIIIYYANMKIANLGFREIFSSLSLSVSSSCYIDSWYMND